MGPGEVVRELMNVAERAGISVRIEPLDPDLFERRRGGICKIQGTPTIVVDSGASLSEKIEVLLHALSAIELDAIYMRPELRDRIDSLKQRVSCALDVRQVKRA